MKSKTKYDIITIGGAVRDITFFIEQGEILKDKKKKEMLAFELGSKVNIKKVYFSLGGGACNTAVGFANFGLKTASIIRIGQDKEGDEVKKNLMAAEVDTRFIQIDRNVSTGFSFISTLKEKSKHVAFLYRGAAKELKITKNILSNIKTNWVYVSSLTGKNWRNILNNIENFIQTKKIKWAWNPGNIQLEVGHRNLSKYLKLTYVLLLNEAEARMLVGSDKRFAYKKMPIKKLLKILGKWGPKIVAITRGKEGAYVYNGQNGKIYYSKSTGNKPDDTTGAGDAFSSGFISGLILFNDIRKALRLGILNSGSVIKKIGAQNGLLIKKDLRNIF